MECPPSPQWRRFAASFPLRTRPLWGPRYGTRDSCFPRRSLIPFCYDRAYAGSGERRIPCRVHYWYALPMAAASCLRNERAEAPRS